MNIIIREIIKNVKKLLPETANVTVENIDKINEKKTAVIVSLDSTLGAVIYVDDICSACESGGIAVSEAAKKIVSNVQEALKNKKSMQEKISNIDFNDWNSVKSKIVPVLVNTDRNRMMLRNRVHKDLPDLGLSVVYKIIVKKSIAGIESVPVNINLFDRWMVDLSVLHAAALENGKRLFPVTVKNIAEVLPIPIPKQESEEDPSLLYVSNDCGIDGAAAILYAQDVLEELCNKRGKKSLFMLPSSIHEFLIVADEKADNVEILECIVGEVNQTALRPGDFLSDSVYGYSKERGIYIV